MKNSLITIDMPQRINIDIKSINKILEIDNTLKHLNFRDIKIDFTKTIFIDGCLSSLFMSILRKHIENNGLNISLLAPIDNKAYNLLKRNGFLGKTEDINDTIIPLRKFNKNENKIFLKYISNHMIENSNKFPFSKDFSGEIKENLAEIFSNCEIHTDTKNIHACGQYFPNKKELSFCLTDIGIGIPEQIKMHTNITDSSEAIKWAFIEGNTTKTSVGGFGLKRLKKSISNRNGQLLVISNDIFYDVIKDTATKLSFDFQGTSVIIKL